MVEQFVRRRQVRRRLITVAICWAGAVAGLLDAGTLLGQNGAANVRGSAAITGTVVDSQTATPVGEAVVVLRRSDDRSDDAGESHAQATTRTGRFAFLNLIPGTYSLTTSKSGYLGGAYGQVRPSAVGAPLELSEGQWLGDVRLLMSRPGSISGVIADERGEPIAGTAVRALAEVMVSGRRQLVGSVAGLTDDRGYYRIGGLGPGKYIVSVPSVQATLPSSADWRSPGVAAGTSVADTNGAIDSARRERYAVDIGSGLQQVLGSYSLLASPSAEGRMRAYPSAFFPSARSPNVAVPIDLDVGESRTGVNMQLEPEIVARVAGRVTGPTEAVGNLQLRLMRSGTEDLGQGSEAASTMTMADGSFVFVNVPSGSYTLQAQHSFLELFYTSVVNASTALPVPVAVQAKQAISLAVSAAPTGVQLAAVRDRAAVAFWGHVPVDVREGRDVIDVELELRPPVKLSGRMSWAGDATPSSLLPLLVLEPADGQRSLGLPVAGGNRLQGSNSFRFDDVLPGEYFLRIGFGDRHIAIESITWQGEDYSSRPFDARGGSDISDVVVTLTSIRSIITGSVTDESGRSTPAAAVAVFPANQERVRRYGFNPPFLKIAFTSNLGRFQVEGLPVGEYYVIAIPGERASEILDPTLLLQYSSRAARIRIDRTGARIEDLGVALIR